MNNSSSKIFALLFCTLSLIFTTGCISDSNTWVPTPRAHLASSQGMDSDYSYRQPDYQPARTTPRYGIAGNITGSVIIIDPGHGGKDPGATGNGIREKNINLDIARKLGNILQSAGGRVIMTRTNDVFISLDARAASADQYNADLLVSIHADSIGKSNISGATVLTGAQASRNSKRAAWMIEAELENSGIDCRGHRSQKLRVCDGHSKPAVLVETGFLTNRQEAINLDTNWYQDKIANAIAKGVIRYLNSQ